MNLQLFLQILGTLLLFIAALSPIWAELTAKVHPGWLGAGLWALSVIVK